MLIALPPVGIVLMWTGKKFNKIIRIILTVFFSFVTLFDILLFTIDSDETTSIPETTSNISALTTESKNILMVTELKEAPVMNGFKTEKIGTYAYIELSDKEFNELTPEEFYEFAINKVDNSGYNWVSIVSGHGYGACWGGSFIQTLTFGELDDEHCIINTSETWELKENTYIPIEEETDTITTTEVETETENKTTTTKKATAATTTTKKETTTKQKSGITVYTTPTGKKYHYSKKCAGKNAIEKDLDDVESLYGPCGNCVN